ncbi:MAG: hypothetical protein ACRDTJ_13320, partial [Pseudonocardiaceae bacterium]
MTDSGGQSWFPEPAPQENRQRNMAKVGGKINSVQRGDQTLQENSQAQHLHLYRVDAEEVIAKLRGQLDQALIRIGRPEHHSETLAERLAAAEARVVELERQLDDVRSRRRETAARRRLIASLRTSFGKIKVSQGYTNYRHADSYNCLGGCVSEGSVRSAYACENIDLFLRKCYDLANADPVDLMHYLVTLESFPSEPGDAKLLETGYCVKEIDCYVAHLRNEVNRYFDVLDGDEVR